MQVVLLSGGSGKRLWPITGEQNAKQFLRVLQGENGEESMLERILHQLCKTSLAKSLTIVTGAMQRDLVVSQLGDFEADVLAEPERRNTFPAIALACAWLRCEKKCSLDEAVLVLPVDSYVDDKYFSLLTTIGEELSSHKDTDVVLVGTPPTYPSHKYGYIIHDNDSERSMKVISFREKPGLKEAMDLKNKGALWNCGVFAFRLGYIFEELARRVPVRSYSAVLEHYAALENDSIDRVLLEKGARARVIRYDGSWMDVGTWNTLSDVIERNSIGNARMKGCENTHVLNTTDKPVVVMGASDMVVVVNENGVLVTNKFLSSFVLDMLEGL